MIDPDRIFRILLIAGFLIFLPMMAYHRLKAHATREPLDRLQEGLFILVTLRPAGLAFMAGLVAYMIDPASMQWSSMPLPVWARLTGVGVAMAGMALMLWTLRRLGPNLTDTVVTRRAHTLVTSGPYRWVRHPFYDATLLIMIGNALAAANWFLLLAGALVYTLMVVRTRQEEERLLARFGDDYRRYLARTGRFLPRFRRLFP